VILFDLDGTLADVSHAQHLIMDKSRINSESWDKFYLECTKGKPIAPIIMVMHSLMDSGHVVEIWTGRSGAVARETAEWLGAQAGVDPGMSLNIRMREVGDHTPDVELKEHWLDEELAMGNKIDLVFEDRSRVVAMWRRRGIVCCQVAPGDF
jgi:hypothetical protein